MTDEDELISLAPDRRSFAIVRITREMMLEIAIQTIRGNASIALPSDAQYRGTHYNFSSDCFELMYEHPSFPAVMPGELIPVVEVKPHEDATNRAGGSPNRNHGP